MDPWEVVEGWSSYEEGQRVVVAELERNTERLRVLINGQWDRLRKGKGTGAGEVEGKTGTFLFQILRYFKSLD